MEWQPIESAPKDGSVILAWRFYPIAIRWAEGDLWGWQAMPLGAMFEPFEENGYLSGDPALTHWMPLPPPPGEKL
jgi:hypothetical protein